MDCLLNNTPGDKTRQIPETVSRRATSTGTFQDEGTLFICFFSVYFY